jgi:hypothetical protein
MNDDVTDPDALMVWLPPMGDPARSDMENDIEAYRLAYFYSKRDEGFNFDRFLSVRLSFEETCTDAFVKRWTPYIKARIKHFRELTNYDEQAFISNLQS